METCQNQRWSRIYFTFLTQPLGNQRRGWKQSYPDFLAADCEQIRCGPPRGGCCTRLRSSAPPEGIQGNSSHSRKQKQCGPLGWRQRKIHQGPKRSGGREDSDLKERFHKWWFKRKRCPWAMYLTSSSIGPRASFSIRPWLLEEMSLFCTSSSGDKRAAFSTQRQKKI